MDFGSTPSFGGTVGVIKCLANTSTFSDNIHVSMTWLLCGCIFGGKQ